MGVYSSKAFAGLTILSIVLGVAIVEFTYSGLGVLRPMPFDYFASVVPLDWYAGKLSEKNFTVYLPTELPEKFNLTAVYARVEENGELSSPTAVLVYSNSGDINIETAEFGLEIAKLSAAYYTFYGSNGSEEWLRIMRDYISKVSNSSREWLTVIGNWTAYVNVKAHFSAGEYRDKYGTEYALCIDLVIDGFSYGFRFAPTLTLEDAINIVSSMRPYRLP